MFIMSLLNLMHEGTLDGVQYSFENRVKGHLSVIVTLCQPEPSGQQ